MVAARASPNRLIKHSSCFGAMHFNFVLKFLVKLTYSQVQLGVR